jgi:predicted RNA polymerase sigma factor
LARLGRAKEARDAFLAAAELAGNAREKALMAERAAGQAQRLTGPASGRSV